MELASATSEYFNMFDIKTHFVISAGECREFLKTNEIDMMLLDINLKDGSGFELCKEIREKSQIPILFISARQSDDDVLIALNIGGDDYIKKPFSVMELITRVKALLRRTEPPEIKTLSLDGLTINNEKREVRVDDEIVELTFKEYELLQLLLINKGMVMPRDTIMDHIWGISYEGESRTLDMHIKTLRQKLGAYGSRIRTVRNVGYVIE